MKGQLVKLLALASLNRQKFHKAVSYEFGEKAVMVGSLCINLEEIFAYMVCIILVVLSRCSLYGLCHSFVKCRQEYGLDFMTMVGII